jgi:hypothetical protein
MDEKKPNRNEYFKTYNKKRHRVGCMLSLEKYAIVKEHAKKKGYTSLNSYFLALADADLKNE